MLGDVLVASGYLWLAFPEHDQCFFAHMEARLDETLDLDGKDYALFVKPKFLARQRKLTGGEVEKYHLFGELRNTAYGTFYVYYTGSDPRYRALAPKRYYFFRRQRGYVSDEQIAAGREVWAATGAKLGAGLADQNGQGDGLMVELNADTVYQVSVDASPGGDWELVILDDSTGARIRPVKGGEQEGKKIFRTTSSNRIRLALRKGGGDSADQLPISRISIREIAPVVWSNKTSPS